MTAVTHPYATTTPMPWLAPDAPTVACASDPETWFPEEGKGASPASRLAKELCAACPLLNGCREWALTEQPRAGIWAGLGSKDRARLAQQRRRNA